MRASLSFAALILLSANAFGADGAPREEIPDVPMPPGFRIETTELEGPVFADPSGKTLYTWPLVSSRLTAHGDRRGAPSDCNETVTTTTMGGLAPYPPGLILPDIDKRLSCAQAWPPVYAAADAKPVGAWSVIARQDGRGQWAYEGMPVYTSVLDREPGDTWGGTKRPYVSGQDTGAARIPLNPNPAIPPGFKILNTGLGRLVLTGENRSVYSFDGDRPHKSNCDEVCTLTWMPILAAATIQPRGEWTVFERKPGVLQWAFRKKPLYTYVADTRPAAVHGNELGGWRNVYTQPGPPPPREFTLQDSDAGEVLADRNGKTIYVYNCTEDSVDSLACDHPTSSQVYRIAICGGGDVARCLKTFPYVEAARHVKATSRSWSVISIDPMTGAYSKPGEGLRVWAYRGRPVYTYAGDHAPGDTNGNSWGQEGARRNGFKAFIVRDYFFDEAR